MARPDLHHWIAKLVPITPITMVYGTYNYGYWGESKPTNITGGPHIAKDDIIWVSCAERVWRAARVLSADETSVSVECLGGFCASAGRDIGGVTGVTGYPGTLRWTNMAKIHKTLDPWPTVGRIFQPCLPGCVWVNFGGKIDGLNSWYEYLARIGHVVL